VSVGFSSSNGEVDLESLRARLRKMNDVELRRYGHHFEMQRFLFCRIGVVPDTIASAVPGVVTDAPVLACCP